MIRWLAIILAILVPATVASAEETVIGSDFLVISADGAGGTNITSTTTVPLLPDVCYAWRLRLAGIAKLLKVVEIFTLPAPPKLWGGVDGNEYSPSTLSADRRVSETTKFYTPKDGWISNGWCVAEGDPAGRYSIRVTVDGHTLHEFNFTVQSPSDK
jgi:hypothetical protein